MKGAECKIYIRVDNITIKRNRLASIYISTSSAGIAILQNNIGISSGSPTYCIRYIETGGNFQCFVSNNILNGYYGIDGAGNSEIKNNTFKTGNSPILNLNGCLLNNNIILSTSIFNNCINNVYQYNMSSDSQLPEGNGNINNVDMNTVFVDDANNDYHLLPDSPARGAGENGTDMGIYGGDTPYVDGGFPGLPSILQIQAPNAGSQQSGLDINFKAKSNK